MEVYSSVLSTISTGILIWKTIVNSKTKDSSDESEGDEDGNFTTAHRCLAAAAKPSGADNQIYLTRNCGAAEASWICVQNGKGCNYFNVYSHDQGESRMLTALNTRQGADLYVKKATSGTWQTWAWYLYGICSSGCLHGQHGGGHAIPRLAAPSGGFEHSLTKPSTLWPGLVVGRSSR